MDLCVAAQSARAPLKVCATWTKQHLLYRSFRCGCGLRCKAAASQLRWSPAASCAALSRKRMTRRFQVAIFPPTPEAPCRPAAAAQAAETV